MATDEFKPFSLDSLESDDTTIIQLTNPKTGDDIEGVTIEVYGQDSEIFRAESRKVQAKCADYMRRNRGKSIPPEDFDRLDRAKVVACTKSINGLSYKGQPLTDPQELFTRFPWALEQVVAGIMDRANFIKG